MKGEAELRQIHLIVRLFSQYFFALLLRLTSINFVTFVNEKILLN